MRGKLGGKITLVTGAGQGLGTAMVNAFAREGARVHAWSRTESKLLDQFAGNEHIITKGIDLSDEAAVSLAASEIGTIDVLVNNAGWVPGDTLLNSTSGGMRQSFEQNVMTAYFASRAFAPGMIEKGYGTILNMSSVLSSEGAALNRFSYGMAKAALVGMTKAIALEYAGRGIRCNAICPGAIETEGLNARVDAMPDPDSVRHAMKNRTPLDAIGCVANVAELCVYLASDAGNFATGQTFVIDGGMAI